MKRKMNLIETYLFIRNYFVSLERGRKTTICFKMRNRNTLKHVEMKGNYNSTPLPLPPTLPNKERERENKTRLDLPNMYSKDMFF